MCRPGRPLLLLVCGSLLLCVTIVSAAPPNPSPIVQALPGAASLASNPDPPVASFQADGRTFRPTGVSTRHFSVWTPLALCEVPPFERVIPRPRGAHIVQGPTLVVAPGGGRVVQMQTYRLAYEKLVPLSIWPEQVSTVFSQGSTASASQGSGVYLSSAWAVGFGAGFESAGVGFSMSVKKGIEATTEAAAGARRTVTSEVRGGYVGNNWLCAEEAVVFATQTLYDCYEYACVGAPNLTVWINVPVDVSSRLFSLTDWNSYASEKNDAGELLRNLPVFTATANLSGDVTLYPQRSGDYRLRATDRFGSDASTLWTGGSLYIDRAAGSLASSHTVTQEAWYSTNRRVGATTEFEAEGTVPGAKITGSSSLAIGQTFTTELAAGHSIAGEWHTSSVHPKLDGGTGSVFDYHFRMHPRLVALTYFPGPSFDKLAVLAARLNSLYATSRTGLEVVQQEGRLYVTGLNKPLSLLADAEASAPYCGRVLLLDYVVSDLGKSYARGLEETLRLAQALVDNQVLLPVAPPPTQPPQSSFWVQIPWSGLQLATPVVAKPGSYLANPIIFDPRELTFNPSHPTTWGKDLPWDTPAR